MRIGSRDIGPGHPPYVIAEIGVNHDGEVSRALELVDAAAGAGADAVKMQYFETDRLMSKAAKLAAYQKAAGETDPVAMLRRLELSLDDMAQVVDCAHERGVHAIVTVFSVELVKPAARLAWDAFKSASPDVVNKPLLEALAAQGKPMIVSTGASTLEEVVRARGWLDRIADHLAFLQCVSSYPTAPENEALGGIIALGDALDTPIGYSDHTPERTGARAVSFGACILEKHITYDKGAAGPDHAASLWDAIFGNYVEKSRFGLRTRPAMIAACRDMQATGAARSEDELAAMIDLGSGQRGLAMQIIDSAERNPIEKRVLDCERDVREVSRQSVVAVRDITPGEVIGRADLTVKRPGTGIGAWMLDEVVGRRAARAIAADVPMVEADLG